MKMTLEGFVEYKRREFCKDIKCPVQMELNKLTEASPAYEQTGKNAAADAYIPHGSFTIG